jgi:hypothetical protein
MNSCLRPGGDTAGARFPNRYYHPQLGCFVSRDVTQSAGMNLYGAGFVLGGVDPTGWCPVPAIADMVAKSFSNGIGLIGALPPRASGGLIPAFLSALNPLLGAISSAPAYVNQRLNGQTPSRFQYQS